jgi:hypothetical protein
MAFMGTEKLLGFKRMIAALEGEDWDTAGVEIATSQWAADVGPERCHDICMMIVENRWPILEIKDA